MEYLQDFIDWFNSLHITIDQIILVIFLVFIVGGFFKGFLKGLWKTSFSAIMTVVLIAIAFFATPSIVNFVKNLDLTQFNIMIGDVQLTSLKNLPEIIESIENVGPYFKDTDLAATIVEVVFAFLSLTIFTGLVTLVWSMGWIITTPLYHLIFKHFIPKVLRKKKRRLLGGLFGAFQALVVLSMLLLPYSMADIIVSEVDAEKHGEQIEIAFSVSTAYGRSFIGQMMDFLSMYGAPLDEAMINYLTGMKIKNEDTSMLQELKHFARAYNVLVVNDVVVINGEDFRFDQNKLTDSVINDFVDALFDAKLSNTVLTDLLIIAVNTVDNIDELGFDINETDKEEVVTAIKEIVDWKSEIKVFVSIYSELVDDDNKMLDFKVILADDDKVDAIAENIGDSSIFKAAFPIAFRFLMNTLVENEIITDVDNAHIEDSILAIKDITDYKSEILALATIYKTIADENGEVGDIQEIFKDDAKIDTIANTVNTSVLINELVPFLVNSFLGNEEFGPTLTEFGINTEEINVFDDSILWGDELKVIASVMDDIEGFDSENLDSELVLNIFANLKQSALIRPVLPSVVANLVNKIDDNINMDDISTYVNLNYLPGLLKYDLDEGTDYFDKQLESLFEIFDLIGSSGIDFESGSFVPILEIIRDLENDAAGEADITINIYTGNQVTGQESIKPTVIAPRTLENLVRTIADQGFVQALLGNDAVDNLDYDALYDDEYELDRIGDIITMFFNGSDLISGNDAEVAANLTLLSSSKLIKPVLPTLIETQFNTYLGPDRQISVTAADLENVNWTNEITAVRYLQNQFTAAMSFETVTPAVITNLFSAVNDTNIIYKVVVNELNDYMDELDAPYVFDKTRLGTKQSATLNKLLEFKDAPTLSGDRSGLRTLVSGFGVFDQPTYDKDLINAILPSFMDKINTGRSIDKSVFNASTSYQEASDDINAVLDAIAEFESATIVNIQQKAEALRDALNGAGDLASELIVHSGVEFEVPVEVKSYFEGQITNTRIEAIINYQ